MKLFLAVGYLLFAICSSAHAGTIHLSAAGPSPSLLRVLTNEPVIFVADDAGPYAVVSFNWAAGTIYLPSMGSTGQVVLAFSGIYNYEDGRGGFGTIYVNIPPSCKITNPTNNAVFTAPASFDFTVDARNIDQDGLIGVDFWLDETYLDGLGRFDEFVVPVTNLGPGTYKLIAVAIDYSYAIARATNIITVLPPTLLLSNTRKAGSQFVFDVSGLTVGKSVVLDNRSALTDGNWAPLQTNVATATIMSLTNPITPGASFFRARQLP